VLELVIVEAQKALLGHSTHSCDQLQDAFGAVRRLIRSRTPESSLHREMWGVSPYKYRSEVRRQTLQRAVEGLVIAKVFERLFGKAIFPRFATVDCRR